MGQRATTLSTWQTLLFCGPARSKANNWPPGKGNNLRSKMTGLRILEIESSHLSNEKNLGWLGFIRDYTTQLYRDYNERL